MLSRIFLLFITGFFFLKAQGQETATYLTFGDNRMDRGKLIFYPNPQSIVIAGETEDNSGGKLLFLTSLTPEGKINWYKTYSGSAPYAVNDGVMTSDGGFILSAEQYYQGDRETLYLMKLDAQGNIQWTQLFDEGGNEVEGLSIAQASDGGYVITGLIKVASIAADVFFTMKQEHQYLYLLKTDGKGNREWSRKFNYSADAGARGDKVVETTDGFLVGGSIGVKADANTDILMLKVDKKGNFLWAKSIGGNKNESIKDIILNEDGFWAAGHTRSFGEGQADAFLMQLGKNGELKGFKTYGGTKNESVSSIVRVGGNRMLMAGETQSFGKGIYDLMMLMLKEDGEVITSETFGTEKHEGMGMAGVNDHTIELTGFCFTASGEKSAQAFLLSYPLTQTTGKCFFQSQPIRAKNQSQDIVVKYLEEKMLSEINPLQEREKPQKPTTVQNTTIIPEILCK